MRLPMLGLLHCSHYLRPCRHTVKVHLPAPPHPRPRYLTAIQLTSQHLLRYLAVAVVVNKRECMAAWLLGCMASSPWLLAREPAHAAASSAASRTTCGAPLPAGRRMLLRALPCVRLPSFHAQCITPAQPAALFLSAGRRNVLNDLKRVVAQEAYEYRWGRVALQWNGVAPDGNGWAVGSGRRGGMHPDG